MNPSYGLIHQAEVDLILKWLTIETDISPGVANLSFLKNILENPVPVSANRKTWFY